MSTLSQSNSAGVLGSAARFGRVGVGVVGVGVGSGDRVVSVDEEVARAAGEQQQRRASAARGERSAASHTASLSARRAASVSGSSQTKCSHRYAVAAPSRDSRPANSSNPAAANSRAADSRHDREHPRRPTPAARDRGERRVAGADDDELGDGSREPHPDREGGPERDRVAQRRRRGPARSLARRFGCAGRRR